MTRRFPPKDDPLQEAEAAHDYAEGHAGGQFRAALKDLISLEPTGDLLEVGAGPGSLAVLVAKANPRVLITATDISRHMMEVAREHVERAGLGDRVTCTVMDAADETAVRALGQFDLVYCTFTLHHWEKPVRALSALWSAVKEGGTLYVHDLKRVWWLYYLPGKGGFMSSVRASYTPPELQLILRQAGIEACTMRTPFPYFWQSITARKVAPGGVGCGEGLK